MTVTFAASYISDTALVQNYGNSITNAAIYTSVAANQMAILSVVTRTETMTYGTPTNGTWTALTSLTGGDAAHGVDSTGTDAGLSKMGTWYQVLVGTETGNVFTSTTPNTTPSPNNCQIANIISYTTDQASWETPIAVSGSDDAHGTARSVTFGTWASALQTGDVVIVINAIDTDNQALITSPTLTQTGTTFNSPTFRTKGFSSTQADQAHYIWEFTVASGGSTNAPTFTWTGGPGSCGPAIAVRIRDVPSNPPQTVNLSLVEETNVGQVFTGAKSAATALISDIQTAQAINEQKTKAIALTTTTAIAQAITYSRQQAVNLLTINQTALPIIATFTARVNLVTETDSVFTHTKRKTKTLALTVSDHFILGLAGQHQKTLALTSDEGIAQALNEQKLTDIEVVLEDGIAQPITRQRGYNINLVSEIDQAIVLGATFRLLQVVENDSIPLIQRFKRRSLALITETDSEQTIQPFHTDLVAQVTETDTAQPQHIIYSRLVSLVGETDTAFAVDQFLKRDLSLVSETDSVGDLIDFIKQKLLALVVGTDIAVAIGPKLQHPPSSIILDVIIPDPTQLTVYLEDDEVTSGLTVFVSQRF